MSVLASGQRNFYKFSFDRFATSPLEEQDEEAQRQRHQSPHHNIQLILWIAIIHRQSHRFSICCKINYFVGCKLFRTFVCRDEVSA